ncbi:MAG: hypothetical protein KAR87_05125 [Candidatus Aenigmarchaeota archaeon]|nr:hypothetical protein [Candidatus Aenigmarchaeota archaeon]
MKKQINHIISELEAHLPYTIFSVAFGIILLGLLSFISVLLNADNFPKGAGLLFHVFHPMHMLFSATATTAMFWRHEKKLLKAVVIGFFGAVVVCGVSDIVIPFIAGTLLGVKMHLHICILEHPQIILPFLAVGIFTGLIVPKTTKSTIFSHSTHVFISSMASILYLISFGLTEWVHHIGAVFIFIILAVIVPCCTSDIIFPLLFLKDNKKNKSKPVE